MKHIIYLLMIIVFSGLVFADLKIGDATITNADWGDIGWDNITTTNNDELDTHGWQAAIDPFYYTNTQVYNGTRGIFGTTDKHIWIDTTPAQYNYTQLRYKDDVVDPGYFRVKDKVAAKYNYFPTSGSCFNASGNWLLIQIFSNSSGQSMYVNGAHCVTDTLTDSYDYYSDFNFHPGNGGPKYIDDLQLGWFDGNSAPAPPPASASGINVTIAWPSDNAGFNAVNNTGNLWINGTHNESAATVCTINDTDWTNSSPNLAMGFNWTFYNNTFLTDDKYYFIVRCNLTGTENGSNSISFTYDSTSPLVDPLTILFNNQTVVYNYTLSTQINFSDPVGGELYSLYVNTSNGTIITDLTNMGVSTYVLDIDYNVGEQIADWIDVKVCDAHTNNYITTIDTSKEKAGIKFIVNDGFLWFDEWVHIYPKEYSSFLAPPTPLKELDRYPFTFIKTTTATTETFIVKSTQPLDIPKKQNYKGHIVIPNLGEHGYWVDFENEDVTDVNIKLIDEYTAEITVYGLKGKEFTFNSIGELNCVYKRYLFGNLNPVIGFDYTGIVGSTEIINLNITEDANTMAALSATLYYNFTAYPEAASNFSQTVTTPSDVTGNAENISFTWVITTNGVDYNLTTYQQNISNFFLDNCSLYPTNSITFNMKNVTNGDFTTDNASSMDFRFDYTYGTTTKIYSHVVNSNNQTFCIFPSGITLDTDILSEYSTTGSNTFTYDVKNTMLSSTLQTVTLYVTGETSFVTFHVTDTFGDELEGYTVRVQSYDLATNTFNETSVLTTDWNGDAFGYVNLYDTWYNFIIEYNGAVLLNTGITKVTSSTVNFVVSLVDAYYDEGITPQGTYATLVFDNSTKWFYYTWSSLATNINESCLNVKKHTLNSITTINQSCSSSASGTIILGIGDDVQDFTYVATGLVVIEGTQYPTKVLTISFDQTYEKYGLSGVFATFIIVVTMAMVGIWNISVGIILSLLGLSLSNILGLIYIPIQYIVIIWVLAIIAIVRINRR